MRCRRRWRFRIKVVAAHPRCDAVLSQASDPVLRTTRRFAPCPELPTRYLHFHAATSSYDALGIHALTRILLHVSQFGNAFPRHGRDIVYLDGAVNSLLAMRSLVYIVIVFKQRRAVEVHALSSKSSQCRQREVASFVRKRTADNCGDLGATLQSKRCHSRAHSALNSTHRRCFGGATVQAITTFSICNIFVMRSPAHRHALKRYKSYARYTGGYDVDFLPCTLLV